MRSKTEIKLDELLGLLSKAVYKENQKKVEKLRPQIVRAMNAFQKEEGGKNHDR